MIITFYCTGIIFTHIQPLAIHPQRPLDVSGVRNTLNPKVSLDSTMVRVLAYFSPKKTKPTYWYWVY